MNFEPKHRLVRKGLAAKVEKPSRKLRKERKNRAKSEYHIALGRLIISDCVYFFSSSEVRGIAKKKGATSDKKKK